jgi:hypothetical protein
VALRNGPAPRSGALERFVSAPRGEEVQEYSRVTNSTDGRALLKGQGLYTDEWRMWAAIGCVDPFVIAQRGTPRVLGRIPLGWGPPRKARCSKYTFAALGLKLRPSSDYFRPTAPSLRIAAAAPVDLCEPLLAGARALRRACARAHAAAQVQRCVCVRDDRALRSRAAVPAVRAVGQ